MTNTVDALHQAYLRIQPALDQRRAKRAELRKSGWRALRIAVRMGYDLTRDGETGYYHLWMPSRRDEPVLLAAGWETTGGPLLLLEGR